MDLERVWQSWQDCVDTKEIRFIDYATALCLGMSVEEYVKVIEAHYDVSWHVIQFLTDTGKVGELIRMENK